MKGSGLKNVHVVIMLVGLIGMTSVLGVGGVLAAGKSALNKVTVDVGDVDMRFTDKKGKVLTPGPKAVLDPAGSVEKFQSGYLRTTLDVVVENEGPIPINVEKVTYKVMMNGVEVGDGVFPEAGKAAITLKPNTPHETQIKIKVPTRKVIKGDLTKVLRGGEVKIRVKGSATGNAMGATVTRDFDVEKDKSYP